MHIIFGPSVQKDASLCLMEFRKSLFEFPLFLLFIRESTCSPSASPFDHEERRSEEFELLLHMALYLTFDEGVLVRITSVLTLSSDRGRTRCPIVADIEVSILCFLIQVLLDRILQANRACFFVWPKSAMTAGSLLEGGVTPGVWVLKKGDVGRGKMREWGRGGSIICMLERTGSGGVLMTRPGSRQARLSFPIRFCGRGVAARPQTEASVWKAVLQLWSRVAPQLSQSPRLCTSSWYAGWGSSICSEDRVSRRSS